MPFTVKGPVRGHPEEILMEVVRAHNTIEYMRKRDAERAASGGGSFVTWPEEFDKDVAEHVVSYLMALEGEAEERERKRPKEGYA